MSVFNKLKGMLGLITVKDDGNNVTIQGYNGRFFEKDLKRLYGTTKVAKYMFTEMTQRRVVFPSFFALEVEFILKQMLENDKIQCSRRVVNKILEDLNENTWLKGRNEPYDNIIDLKEIKVVKLPPMPEQANFLNYYNYTIPRYNLTGAMFSGAPGAGKAAPLTAKLKTPTGWMLNGDAKYGDLLTMPDGTIAPVIGVYPQGMKDVYQVRFSDGRTAECCIDHLWSVIYRKRHSADPVTGAKGLARDVLPLSEMKRMLDNPNMRMYIPLTKATEEPEVHHVIDPYIMGVLIGDGSMSMLPTVTYCKPDEFVKEEIAKLLPSDLFIDTRPDGKQQYIHRRPGVKSNVFTNELRRMGLEGKRSWEKSIPEEYMSGSVEQRLALLQGLMDTDGYIDTHSSCSFTSTSEVMAKQVQQLIWSIGGTAKIVNKQKYYTHNGEKKAGRPSYDVRIRHSKPSELFRLPRKKDRADDNGQYCKDLKLRIDEIIFTGKKEPMQCIMVDHPDHLYITDDYVVTHNTIGSIYVMLALKKKFIFVVAPKKAIWDVWNDTLTNKVNGQSVWVADSDLPLPPGTKWMIFHYQRLDEAVAIARKLKMNPDDVGIILDESHNMNNENAAQTQNFITLCKESGSTDNLWASGTPIKAMGVEAIPLFRTIIPNFTDAAAFAMKKIWSKGGSTEANQILSNRLGVVSFSIPKSKFMSTVPVETTVKVTMKDGSKYTLEEIKILMIKFIEERFIYYRDNKPKFQKIYDDCLAIYKKAISRDPAELADLDKYNKYVEMFIAIGYDPKTMVEESKFCNMMEKERIHPVLPQHLRAPFKDAKSVIKYVDLKIKGECLGRILGKERIDCHVKLVEAIDFATYIDNSLKKTLIFTDFVPALEACQRKMVGIGYTPVVVYGDTNSELVSIVKDFRSIPDVNPCIATYRSLAEAVPLTEANTGLMINKPFRYHHYSQAVSRMHRIGQDDTVYIFNFVLDTGNVPNISTRSEDIMDWSKQQVDQLMGLNKYGSNVDVIDIDELGVGVESMKEYHEGSPTDGSFLSAGNETYLDMLIDEDLFVTEVSSVPVELPRSKVSAW